MTIEPCRREEELLDALGRGFVGPELDAHVAECSACSELRTVAGALLEDRVRAMAEAPVPSAGTMWWRMRIRQRQEAETGARRSLLVGQAVTLAIAIALVVSFFGTDLVLAARDLAVTIQLSTPLLLALVILIVVAPIAGWVALRQS